MTMRVRHPKRTSSCRGTTADHRRLWTLPGLAIAVALTITGCTAGTPTGTPAPTHTSSVTPVAGSAAACVPDPKKVATATDTQSTKPMPAALATKYDAAATTAFDKVKESAPSVIVGVRSPKGTWEKAYGLADIATKTPSTTNMYQRIGSITKTFVATVILQLADKGKLSLDDPIDDYVPDVPNGSRITLHELITMTSGLPSYNDDTQFGLASAKDPSAQWTPKQLLAVAYSMPTSFPPGTNFEYSNTNYILLGLVIEHVTGKPLSDVITSRVLKPLHMTSTSFPAGAALPNPHPNGYVHASPSSDAWTDTAEWNPSWAWAAGAMTSRMGDLLRWGRVLATGEGVLPTTTQVERLSSFGTSDLGVGGFYGIGLFCSAGWIGHEGNIPGYNTMLGYYPATDTTIVVEATGDSTSRTPPHSLAQDVVASALATASGHPYPPVVVTPAAQTLAAESDSE